VQPSISAELLAWDSQFFGFPVARIESRPADDDALGQTISALRSNGARLAYWQADPEDAESNGAAGRHGGLLVNRRAEFSRAVTAEAGDGGSEIMAATAGQDDHARLHDLALQSGEQSRFRLDPAIPEERWASLYRSWMDESLAGNQADAVLVRRREGRIAGMITVSAGASAGEIGLFAVAAEARGQGVGSALLADAMRWFAANGCADVRVATQGENQAARAAYERAGFRLQRLVNVFHFWI
jgi:dTDP-4-amino-4,6-dideoxy-D-galactose acyltransferase